ncbi:MAG TPA: MFS transporter [Ktedonobacterales bacterium]|nr:MFS transporter [Ktedonobacterales bacterium]
MLASYLSHFRSLGRNTKLYLISNTIGAVATGAAVVLYTLYLAALGYDTGFIGLLAVVGTLGAALGILPSQPLVNHFGWRTMLIWSNLLGGGAVFLQLVVPVAPVLVVTTVAVGASAAIYLVINSPLLAANSAPEQRTAVFGLNAALQFLALIAGNLLGGWLPTLFSQPAVRQSGIIRLLDPLLLPGAEARTYQLSLLVTGILATPMMLPILYMRNQPAVAGAQLATSPWLALPSREQLAGWIGAVRDAARGVIGRFTLSQTLLGFGAGLWFPYIGLYVVNQLGASTAFYGLLTAVLSVLMALASLLSAPLAARFGTVPTAVLPYLASLPFLIAIGLFPLVPVVAAAYLVRGTLVNFAGPAVTTFQMGAVPARSRVVANSAYNVSYQIAWALGAQVGGLVVSAAGYQLPFLLAAPCYAASALLLAYWFWRTPSPSDVLAREEAPSHSAV